MASRSPNVQLSMSGRHSCNVFMERETGFEPATPCLEGRNSTAELLPPES